MLSKLTKKFKPIACGATTPKAWVFLFKNIMITSKSKLGNCYKNLLINLVVDFGIKSINVIDGVIIVDCSTGLFDYDKYHFYNKTIKSMPITKYIKQFSNKFYAEFYTTSSMQISINS